MVSGIIMGSLVSKLSCVSWRKGRQTLGASFSQFVKLSQRFRIFLMGREILRKIAECMLLVWIGVYNVLHDGEFWWTFGVSSDCVDVLVT